MDLWEGAGKPMMGGCFLWLCKGVDGGASNRCFCAAQQSWRRSAQGKSYLELSQTSLPSSSYLSLSQTPPTNLLQVKASPVAETLWFACWSRLLSATQATFSCPHCYSESGKSGTDSRKWPGLAGNPDCPCCFCLLTLLQALQVADMAWHTTGSCHWVCICPFYVNQLDHMAWTGYMALADSCAGAWPSMC